MEKLKYDKPDLIDMSAFSYAAQVCSPSGSAAGDVACGGGAQVGCSTGSFAQINCGSQGNSATGSCNPTGNGI